MNFKKSVLILCVVVSASLLATDLKLQYKDALKAYKSKDFRTSYDILSKLYLTNLSDVKFNFYLGRSAFETGHYEIALAAFERVEMLQPNNLRNKLEMARTYFMLKMYEESENAFEEVLNNPDLPSNVRRNIEIYLTKVKKVQQKSFTYANVKVDFLYDSNVNFGSLDSDYNVNIGGGFVPIHSSEQTDTALQVYADLTNIYDIGDKNGFAIKNRFVGMLKDYRDLDTYDVKYIGYMPSLIYKYTKYTVDIGFGIDNLSLGKKSYLTTLYFMPRYEYAHTNLLRSIVYAKLQRKLYQRGSSKDMDAVHYELSYALQNILSPSSYIQGNFNAIYERKEHGNRVDVDYDEYRFGVVYANQFSAKYSIDIYGEYRIRNYEDYSPLFTNTREDKGINVSVKISRKILNTLRLYLKGTYNRVDSNQQAYAYDKYTISLGLNKAF